jgi:hypothetical protein
MKEDEGLFRFARFIKQLALGVIVLVGAVLLFAALFLVRQVDPEESWRLAERELKGSVLRYGERPIRIAKVYRRRGTNYFREANGLLVATPTRLLFVGIEPRDKLSTPDAPPTIITGEFPNDTLLELSKGRVYMFTAYGVRAQRDGHKETYAVKRAYQAELDSLIEYVHSTNTLLKRQAAEERALRAKVAEVLNRPLYYEVKRGDALFNIATRFGTTPEQLQVWNNLQSDRVRIRDTLLVKPAGPKLPPSTK